jgi:hypothetical protein
MRQALYAGKVWFAYEDDIREIERQDDMAILHPDTSKIPIWRHRPTRVEHPMEAWRAWGMELTREGHDFFRGSHKVHIDAHLKSVAADCEWDGPVLRSHKRPVDPKYWDSIRNKKIEEPMEYYAEMRDTLELAGVWAVKTMAQAIDVAHDYDVSTYGRIKMWGRVAQFKLGYRAEACMIDELWVMRNGLFRMFNVRNDRRDKELIESSINAVVKSLENRYQCKVNLA